MWNEIIPYEDLSLNPEDDVYPIVSMNHFTKRYLHLYVKAERWVEYDGFSVIVQMYNGDTYLYDDSEDQIRRIKLIDDSSDLTEEEWRNGFSYFLDKEIWASRMHKYEIAECAGISNVQLSRYLNKKITPSAYVIQRLADAIGCDIRDILPHDFVPLQ